MYFLFHKEYLISIQEVPMGEVKKFNLEDNLIKIFALGANNLVFKVLVF